jgi:hypothetical protein
VVTASTATSVSFQPPLNSTGQFKNVNSLPASGALITPTNTVSGRQSSQGLLYHKNAFTLGTADKELAQRLTKAGADHGKYLRQISIVVEFTAPEYFLKEFDTYKVGTTRNSSSMMHTLGKHPFAESMFSWENVSQGLKWRMLEQLTFQREVWIEAGKRKGPNCREWYALVQMIPQSWMYQSTWSANYQVLRSMYHARKNHRLQEWRDWCTWTETLPFSDLITG